MKCVRLEREAGPAWKPEEESFPRLPAGGSGARPRPRFLLGSPAHDPPSVGSHVLQGLLQGWGSLGASGGVCGLGHARDLVGQPHTRQAEEGGQEAEDLHKREGPGGAQGKGQSRGQPLQWLVPVPASCTGCGREGAQALI